MKLGIATSANICSVTAPYFHVFLGSSEDTWSLLVNSNNFSFIIGYFLLDYKCEIRILEIFRNIS